MLGASCPLSDSILQKMNEVRSCSPSPMWENGLREGVGFSGSQSKCHDGDLNPHRFLTCPGQPRFPRTRLPHHLPLLLQL